MTYMIEVSESDRAFVRLIADARRERERELNRIVREEIEKANQDDTEPDRLNRHDRRRRAVLNRGNR